MYLNSSNMEQNVSLLSTAPVQKEPIHDLRRWTPLYPGTICVLLYGARASVISFKEIVQALKNYVEVDKTDIEDLYNLDTNTVWFLRLTSEAKEQLYKKLHRLSFTIEDGSVKFFLIHIENIYLLGSLHGVPAHFTHNDVDKIISCVSLLHRSAFLVRSLGGGSWDVMFLFRNQRYVPHYVDIHYSVSEHQTVVLTLNGRVNSNHFRPGNDCRVLRIGLSVLAKYIIRKIFC